MFSVYTKAVVMLVFTFYSGAICGPKKTSSLLDEDDEESEGKESLLPDSMEKTSAALPVSVAAHIPKSVRMQTTNQNLLPAVFITHSITLELFSHYVFT